VGRPGVKDKVRTRGKNQRVYLSGALDAHADQLHVGFWPRKNSDAFIEFLRSLLRDIADDTIHLVLDNYGVHKSKRTCAFLASEDGRRIKPIFLPTYSPWLSPIEITWRIVKGRAATNR